MFYGFVSFIAYDITIFVDTAMKSGGFVVMIFFIPYFITTYYYLLIFLKNLNKVQVIEPCCWWWWCDYFNLNNKGLPIDDRKEEDRDAEYAGGQRDLQKLHGRWFR